MKDFIQEDGNRVTNCSFNVAQMSIFEHIRYIQTQSTIPQYMLASKQSLKAIIYGLYAIIALIGNILIFPIALVGTAVSEIKLAKKEMKELE